MVGEAKLVDIGSGLAPEGEGWFVINVRDAAWFKNDAFGYSSLFQEHDRSPQLGVNLGVLEPGRPNCLYHEENKQEAFLVLSGECILIVEGEERRLRTWDFFHCPAGTRHVFVGAGDQPCAILFIGARGSDERVLYPVDKVAAKHGASVKEEARQGTVAYAGYPEYQPGAPPRGMPWDR